MDCGSRSMLLYMPSPSSLCTFIILTRIEATTTHAITLIHTRLIAQVICRLSLYTRLYALDSTLHMFLQDPTTPAPTVSYLTNATLSSYLVAPTTVRHPTPPRRNIADTSST